MNMNSSTGYGRLERGFMPQPATRAPAGAFGRRVFGRNAPAPADPLEVERILARCRARRVDAPAPLPAREHPRRGGQDVLAYIATGLSILALSAISALPIF